MDAFVKKFFILEFKDAKYRANEAKKFFRKVLEIKESRRIHHHRNMVK